MASYPLNSWQVIPVALPQALHLRLTSWRWCGFCWLLRCKLPTLVQHVSNPFKQLDCQSHVQKKGLGPIVDPLDIKYYHKPNMFQLNRVVTGSTNLLPNPPNQCFSSLLKSFGPCLCRLTFFFQVIFFLCLQSQGLDRWSRHVWPCNNDKWLQEPNQRVNVGCSKEVIVVCCLMYLDDLDVFWPWFAKFLATSQPQLTREIHEILWCFSPLRIAPYMPL